MFFRSRLLRSFGLEDGRDVAALVFKRSFRHKLVGHDLLVTNGISQVVASIILRRVHGSIAAAGTALEPVMCVLSAGL